MSSEVSSASRCAEAIDELRKLQQVCQAEERALLAEGELRIRTDHVGPLRRNGTDGLLIDPQEKTSSIAGVPLAHAEELPPTQWVKWMREAHKARRCDRSIRILD
jgi:hypothetical protein